MSDPVYGDDGDTLFELRNAARPLGYWVGYHYHFDPARGGGPYYVMERKSNSGAERNPSLIRYASKATVEKFLNSCADNFADDDIVRMVPAQRD
jgi:hypothetical protein